MTNKLLRFLGCPGAIFHFTRDLQKTDYVQYRGPYFPNLKRGTVCAWVVDNTDNDERWRAVFGYASSIRQNELVMFKRGTTFRVFKHGRSNDFNVGQFMQKNNITELAKVSSTNKFSNVVNSFLRTRTSFHFKLVVRRLCKIDLVLLQILSKKYKKNYYS